MTPHKLRFTPQQERILHAAAAGMGQKEIAALLGIADRTAAGHLGRIYEKAGLSTGQRGQRVGPRLTAWALNHGYGPQEVSNA